jgi:SAM-dependent methyltransferase
MAGSEQQRAGLTWQIGVWDRISEKYASEIDTRFTGVVEGVLSRAALRPGQLVLDLGTGTGSVALRAAAAVAPGGHVTAVDISAEMLAVARRRAASAGLGNLTFHEGRAEEIPATPGGSDIVLASLSMMYVIDRPMAAREIARVLRPGGRFIAAVWAGLDEADIVLLQSIAGSFAPSPPVSSVGPGALADPSEFLQQLADAGIRARVETETTEFTFDDFGSAWEALAGVTTAQLSAERQEEAKSAVRARMWPQGDGPRRFHNVTRFIIGER